MSSCSANGAKASIIVGRNLAPPNGLRRMNSSTALDRIDYAILMLLQNDARLSVKEVAAAVGLAPSSAHGRIRQLREAGVLRGAHAEVDPRALGIGLEALLMIGLSKHKRETVDRFLDDRSEEHTSELQSLMRISYAVFCLKKKKI